ncbi:MAG: UDP-N-acetylmuramoyl-L-alanyl-D-glutamate--2,6-diaminopimelate ligase [Lentisphaeria bacterium]|nr:UDP-N-acetylmuramoyl-L-alanyl-D-glutamate--2,6-diaminopimelate ligase [Lentisphaeria bacterium]
MTQKLKFSQFADFLRPLIVKTNIENDFEVTSVVSNSAKAEKNSLFCAVKGVSADGNNYVANAVEKGAGGVISEVEYENQNSIQVCDDRLAYSEAVRFFYGEPDRKLNLLGVTGTNGKTTSVYLFFNLLRELGGNPAFFSTVNNFDGREWHDSDCTTPDAGVLFEFCRRAVSNGADFLPLECSSHALSQKRLGNAKFKIAIFTNLTGDHLDYHCSMGNYFAAKKVLFTENLAEDGTAVINIDDEAGKILAEELKKNGKKVVTFGFAANADMSMQMIDNRFILNGKNLETSLFGKHNFYNITGVLAALQQLGFELETLFEILRTKNISVPGRLEKIDLGIHGTAFVDYAHTDDALKNVLSILKNETERRNSRLICVFGCGGNRDKTKRPRMGRVVSELADEFIVTSDNPRDEEPQDIINDILGGCLKKPSAVEVDREKAIFLAVGKATANDIILVAGKGHEKEQVIKNVRYYFDDCEVLRKFAAKKDEK